MGARWFLGLLLDSVLGGSLGCLALGLRLGTGVGGLLDGSLLLDRSLLDDLSRLLSLGGLLGGLRLRGDGLENELDHCHGRVVALAVADLRDAGVATLTVGDQRCDLGEQRVHDSLVTDDRENATTSVQVSALGEGDQALGERTQALGLGLGRLDRLVGVQSRREVGKQQALVCGAASEAGTLGGLGHI